jgi:hypothetical protein
LFTLTVALGARQVLCDCWAVELNMGTSVDVKLFILTGIISAIAFFGSRKPPQADTTRGN